MRDMGDHCPSPEAMAGWLEQTLSAPDRARVTSHLASCDECRRAAAISSQLEPPAAEGRVDELLLHRVVETARHHSRRPWIAAAAAGLLAAGLAFWILRPTDHEAEELAVVFEPPPARRAPPPVEDAKPVVEAPAPAPKPEPVRVPPEKRPDPAPAPVVEEPRKPAPPPEEPKPEPVPAPKEEPAPAPKRIVGTTEADLSRIFATLFVADPSGDLWLNREGAEPVRVGRYEQVGHKDTVSAHDSAGAFALDGKATVALEKGASVSVAWRRIDQAYSISLSSGSVMVDTEGAAQKWQVSRGATEVTFSNLNGRFVIEPRGDQLATVMLSGRCDLKVGSGSRRLEAGREMVVSADQKVSEKATDLRKFARLGDLRPAFLTVFAATFEEKDEVRPFAYTVPSGRLTTEGTKVYLHAEVPANVYPKPGERVVASCSVKPERPVIASDRIVLAFWYRTNQPTFTIRLGKYAAVYTSRLKPMEWGEGRIQLAAFESDGVPILPTDELQDVQFQATVDGRKSSILDVDGVQFLRRAK